MSQMDSSPARKLIGAHKVHPRLWRSVEVDERGRLIISSSGFIRVQCTSGNYGWFTISGVQMSGGVFASGALTDGVDTRMVSDKTIYWASADSSGVFAIDVQDVGGQWWTFDVVPFTSGNLVVYNMNNLAYGIRLGNEGAMSGTVVAWYMMRC